MSILSTSRVDMIENSDIEKPELPDKYFLKFTYYKFYYCNK